MTADVEYLRLMGNYESFSISDDTLPSVFELTIGSDPLPDYSEEVRQDDGEQTIVCGNTSDESPIFVFR